MQDNSKSKDGFPSPSPIRVVVQQYWLWKYRVPVYRELARREGIDLTVVYDAAGSLNWEPEGFRAEHIPFRIIPLRTHPVYWQSAHWRYARRDRCDVLVLPWDLHYASLVPALVRARLNRVPTILWGHGYSKREARWRKHLRRSVGRLATALLFYNHGTAEVFINSGYDPERIHVALNSLDQAPIQKARQDWTSRPADLQAFRRKHDLKEGSTILFVSRLLYENRVDLLLHAAAHLVSDGFQDLSVVVIGAGSDEARLKALASRLGITQQLRMPGAIYDEMELAPWFLSADVYCYPVNIGLSVLHAFGYGLPVVTSNNIDAHNPEIEALEDGKNGLLYQDGSTRALAAALNRVLNDRALCKHMKARASETVADRFSLPTMVDGFECAIRYCAESCPETTSRILRKSNFKHPIGDKLSS